MLIAGFRPLSVRRISVRRRSMSASEQSPDWPVSPPASVLSSPDWAQALRSRNAVDKDASERT